MDQIAEDCQDEQKILSSDWEQSALPNGVEEVKCILQVTMLEVFEGGGLPLQRLQA